MSENVIFVAPENSIDHCMQLMTTKFIRHLPVVSNDKLIGIISIGDVVKHIIEAHNQTINVRSTPGIGSTFGVTLSKALDK